MSGVLGSTGKAIYKLGFEISPIILTNGVASALGGMLPLVAITEGANLAGGLLAGNVPDDLDAFFSHFRPLPGATLISNDLGRFPFANQSVAANAIIQQPLRLSMRMDVPVNQQGGHTIKFITFLALKAVLDLHVNQGGLFTIATPTYIYTNGVLLNLSDESNPDSDTPQNAWRWDFEFPLITLNQAAAAQSSLMSKLTNGVATDGSLSGPSVASNPLSGAAPSISPGAANLTGASAGGYGLAPSSVTS